jgi:beta-barrel assembly-enhancing protease
MKAARALISGLVALQLIAAPAMSAAPPPITPGYLPQDKDERGLWMQMDEAERDLKVSNFVIRDPELNAYVRRVLCKTTGEAECKDIRLYILRTPYFNAAMAPNGMMLVFSGLFLRTQNEAQLAAILGHEYTHYRNKHSLRNFRDVKAKADAIAWISLIPFANLAVGLGVSLAQFGILGSIMGFSREMEREADAGSIPMLAGAGYDPTAASKVWEQLRVEADATAAARGKKSRKDKDGGMFASHPGSAERMATLKDLGTKQAVAGTPAVFRNEYRAALAPFWSDLVDDQIKLNDFGATEMLLSQLATEGWTSELLFARGELYRARGKPEDLPKAADFFRQSIAAGQPPAEAYRGLGLSLLRSGVQAEGQAALKNYLKLRPDAKDKSMMAMLAGEQK